MQPPSGNQPQPIQGGQPVIVYQVVVPPNGVIQNYHSKQALVLGAIQVAIGILCFILQSITFASESATKVVGAGYWCGVFFILAGCFGIVSAKRKTTSWITAFMVLSIIAAIMGAAVMITSCMGILVGYIATNYDESASYRYRKKMGETVDGMLIFLGVVEMVVAIWSSAVCCAGLCCRKNQQIPVQYFPEGSQPQPLLVQGPAPPGQIYPNLDQQGMTAHPGDGSGEKPRMQ